MGVSSVDDLTSSDYPTAWSEYVGQTDAKHYLRQIAKAARLLNEPIPHILIHCPIPGVGKTALGVLLVRAAQRRVHVRTGQLDINAAQDLFSEAQSGDVVLYDEFHQVMNGGRSKAEWMLQYLISGKLVTPYGVEDVPKVSFVGTTTERSDILPAILDRMELVELTEYNDEEGALIAQSLSARTLGSANLPPLSPVTAARVARAGSNAPRTMWKLLKAVRVLAVTGDIPTPVDGNYDLGPVLRFAKLTEDGLDSDAQKYLRLIMDEMGGRPVSESLLVQRLGLKRPSLMKVERSLMSKQLLMLTPKGRQLTAIGKGRARQLAN